MVQPIDAPVAKAPSGGSASIWYRDSGSDGPRLVDRELLEALEQRWRDQGAAISWHVQVGLPEEEMQAIVSPLGIRLPGEALAWWGGHDGVPMSAGRSARARPGIGIFFPCARPSRSARASAR